MMKRAGGMTVFSILLFTVVLSAIFALLEAARVNGLKANAALCAQQSMDGVMASYQRELWDQYGLLFWEEDSAEATTVEKMTSFRRQLIEDNWLEGRQGGDHYYFLQVHLQEIENQKVELATDHGGLPFRREAALAMKDTLAVDSLQILQEWLSKGGKEDLERDNSADMDDQLDRALQALDTLEGPPANRESPSGMETSGQGGSAGSIPTLQISVRENPLKWLKRISKDGVLALVMPETQVSDRTVLLEDSLERRSLQTGNWEEDSAGVFDPLLFHLYLGKYFVNAADTMYTGSASIDQKEGQSEAGLLYEQEYLIAGKASDRKNLKQVINRLLLMREAANMLYLEKSPEKVEKIRLVATSVSLAAGHPEVEEAVTQAIMVAWAYAESLSDVRILLEGGKVALVKTEDQWHTDLADLGNSIQKVDGASQQKGLSYHMYLQMLLCLVNDDTLSFRAMDVIEDKLQIQMDQMVVRAQMTDLYQAQPLFWRYVTLGSNRISGYQFLQKSAFSFLER